MVLRITAVAETHIHADYLSGARELAARVKTAKLFLSGEAGAEYGFEHESIRDGSSFEFGTLILTAKHTPGHTPACVCYRIGDDVFVGDTLFMHDYGTARADFPGGDARALFRSIKRLLALPPATRLWMCHDYKAPGRDDYAWQSTVAEQRAHNPHVKDGVTEDEFVAFRQARDAKLAAPTLLLPSIQVNIRAGRFPEAESNGVRYLKIPVKARAGVA